MQIIKNENPLLVEFLLKKIQHKDRVAFQTFFNQYYEGLVKFAYGYLYDKQVSEDVVQEVFMYIWENAASLQVKTSFKNFVYAIVRNKCLDVLKGLSIQSGLEVLDVNMQLSIDEVEADFLEEREQLFELLMEKVNELPKQMELIVKLKFLEGLSYKDIAKELGVSVNTVKTQLQRAKVKFSSLLHAVLFFYFLR